MSKATKSAINWLTGSDIGIMLVVLNFIVMGWYGLVKSKPFPDGFGVCVGVIFAGKTTHSVMTWQKGRENGGEDEEQHG